jgi:hypothetical protein
MPFAAVFGRGLQAQKAADVLRAFLLVGDKAGLEKGFADLGYAPSFPSSDGFQSLLQLRANPKIKAGVFVPHVYRWILAIQAAFFT